MELGRCNQSVFHFYLVPSLIYSFVLLSLSLTPPFFFSLYADEEVTSGTIALNVTYGVVPYFSTSLDLCKTLQLKCPIKAGQGSLIFKENIPQFKHVSINVAAYRLI